MNTVEPGTTITAIPGAELEDLTVGRVFMELRDSFEFQEKGARILVEAYLPHVADYGHDPNVSLVYSWPGGPLAVGDLVKCPPTPLGGSTFTGIVTSLDASGHPYKGPVKALLGKDGPRNE